LLAPLRLGLAASDQRLAGAVWMKIYVPNLKRHELTAKREGFVGDTEHGPLAIRAKSSAGAFDNPAILFL
jgi:hypothetical protein